MQTILNAIKNLVRSSVLTPILRLAYLLLTSLFPLPPVILIKNALGSTKSNGVDVVAPEINVNKQNG